MKHYRLYLNVKLAARGLLLLAALFITACEVETPPPESANVPPTTLPADIPKPTTTETLVPEDTPTTTPVPATSLPTVSATPSPTTTAQPSTPTSSTVVDAPTAQPVAATQAVSVGKIQVSETTIILPTYPFRDFLVEEIDPVYNMPVLSFNRLAYEAANPVPTPVAYVGVVLENPYLRLTFLPELGGRLYSAVVKATGQEIFYHNPVVKPSQYGILQPQEANWWLAAGGIEWAYPTQEHGYRWGIPWTYQITENDDSVTVTLSDSAPDRVSVIVEVTLPANSPIFTVRPKLTNNGSETVPVQFWLNAALSLSAGSMSPQTQFIVPTDQIIVHSRGATGWAVPDAHSKVPWPQVEAVDLRDYKQWTDYLGFFVPDTTLLFVGAYNPDSNVGVVRLNQSGTVGNKLFAFSQVFFDRSYTDDESQYFEIWGGVNAGFWPEDDVLVAPGESLHWQEQWWPLAQLGGLTWANQQAALAINHATPSVQLSILVSSPRQGEVIISANGTPLLKESFITAEPTTPLQWQFETVEGPLEVQLLDEQGKILLDYQE